MAWFSVGRSSYPDLFGQEQFTNSQRIADQFWSLAVDMQPLLGKGERLSVNEARRSRPRQLSLWNDRKALGIVVAAPYTSRHDEVNHGNAMDIGVTMANGRNRALTPAEFDAMHRHAEQRGFTWTGRNFNEEWHIEGATRSEVYPPYANARAVSDAEFTKHAANPAPAPLLDESEEDDMKFKIFPHPPTETGVDPKYPSLKGGIFFRNIETGKQVYIADPNHIALIKRVLKQDSTDEMFQSEIDLVIRTYIQPTL